MSVRTALRPTWRTIGVTFGCAVAGVATTFATAWIADHGQPLYFDTSGVLESYSGDWPHPMPRRSGPLPGLGGESDGGPGGWWTVGGGGGGGGGGVGMAGWRDGRPTHVSRARGWGRERLLYTRARPSLNTMAVITGSDESMDCLTSGFPCRSLTRWSIVNGGAPQPASPGATGTLRVERPGGRGAWTLPVRPLWPGFALNSALYAVLAWVVGWTLWSVPRMLRGRLRRARGTCVGCGYDRRGLAARAACPECGRV